MSIVRHPRDRNVTAVLGPTNTGKTHLAIERMLGHESGLIGLPLRLLAREVYDKIAARIGADKVALVTGEEKIKPDGARYWVSTVEAMPRETDFSFLAIDEVQLAADPERGHVFTDRLLHARGTSETLLLGAQTMGGAISDLVPGANFISRPRLSKLVYSGQKKITRLPRRTAIVAFSAHEVYRIAELMRRQRGGAAVVLGALSPRTRNAQVALYQSGDVDFLVATDAIGMGLNLDVDHVAFSAVHKFDGERHRALTPSELAQVAGRAGRHLNDGSFGVTGDVEPFEPDLVERLETHQFDSLKKLQWRNSNLNLSTLDGLHDSLHIMPGDPRLMRARSADDVLALEALSRDDEIRRLAVSPAAVAKLWDVCQVPDYRKISHTNHAELVETIYKYLMAPEERLPEDWFAKQVDYSDRTDGDIDTLSNRIAHIRTWTFVSNRADWLKDPEHWQGRAREIEDKLSDALHEQLTQRFVDKRTSALMRGMRDKDELFAEIADDGAVHVEKHFVGRLNGFRFAAEDQSSGIDGKAARHAAAQVLGPELAMRARRISAAKADAFSLSRTGHIMWREAEVGKLEASDDPLKPSVTVLCDETLAIADRDKVQARLDTWLAETIGERLKPLIEIGRAEDVTGLARGIAFRLTERFGCLRREEVAEEIRSLDQPSRAQLRKYGVRFGAFNIYFPILLKPAAADLLLVLWTLKDGPAHGLSLDTLPEPPRAGLTSLAADNKVPSDFYRVAGFHLCGPRAVRVDMLERLADLIRPLLAWRAKEENPVPPPNGATGEGGFTVIPDMMSILGCSGEELGQVLSALGFRCECKQVAPAKTAAQEAAPEEVPEKTGPANAGPENTGPENTGTAKSDGGPEPGAPEESAKTDGPAGASASGDPATPEPSQAPVPANAITETAKQTDAAEPGVPATETTADGAVAAEPQVIEIWRPARRKYSAQNSRSGAPARQGRRSGGARGAQAGPAGKPGQAGTGGEAAADKPGHSKSGHGKSDQGGARAGQGYRGQRNAGGAAGGRHRGKPGGRPQDKGNKRPQVHSSGPAKSRGGIDPDSPFAALGLLKKELEKGAEDKSST